MKLSEFNFNVPEGLIAQRPLDDRSASRMMVIHRNSGKIEHRGFLDLPEYLRDDDTLVLNRTRVVKARLVGQRSSGGKVEIFLLRRLGPAWFECLVKATAPEKEGLEAFFGNGLKARVLKKIPIGIAFEVEFSAADGRLDFWIEKEGRMPLPPYIRREADVLDENRYQTVYAEDHGSVAAPTAGLHFTPEILGSIRSQGVKIAFVTLHVGLGTFQPIKVENIDDHKMHEEMFSLEPGLLAHCQGLRSKGQRTVAVGTTTVRALESAARGFEGNTDLFLKPGSEFQLVDVLFTNFHQPKSSLVVMLSAFVGDKDVLLEAYSKAVEAKYRFFSYGDSMLVL
jgi:S-adenosylmethionine:tRNA ribosyltransferase-isomerase